MFTDVFPFKIFSLITYASYINMLCNLITMPSFKNYYCYQLKLCYFVAISCFQLLSAYFSYLFILQQYLNTFFLVSLFKYYNYASI